MKVLKELKLGATTLAMRSVVRGLALTGDPVATVLGRKAAEDPYPLYERIRAHGEISRHVIGMHLTAGYGTCSSILRDHRFGVEPAVDHVGVDWNIEQGDEHTLVHPMEQSLLTMNPPGHTRLRKLVAPWFTPNALREFTPTIERIVDELLDELATRPEFDLASQFASRVPIEVVRVLFGIPGADDVRFQRWGAVLTGTLDGIRTLAERRAVRRTVAEMTVFLDDLLAQRREGTGADVLSRIARSEIGGERPAGKDLVALAGLLLVAGFETTINLISSGALLLMNDPRLKQALLDDPSLAAATVEETLRVEPPVQFALRKATEPVTIAGTDLSTGSMIIVLIAGANRDPRVFPDPERFDLLRPNSRDHLAFSSGIHYCLGAGLARAETEVALRRLFQRLPDLCLSGPVRYKQTRNIRGCAKVPVRHATGS